MNTQKQVEKPIPLSDAASVLGRRSWRKLKQSLTAEELKARQTAASRARKPKQ